MDWEVLKACNKVIHRLILKAEKNEFIGRVAERFKKGNPGHTAEAEVCAEQGQRILSLYLTKKEHSSYPCAPHDRVTLIILYAFYCCYYNTLLLTYQLNATHLFSYRFGDHLK